MRPNTQQIKKIYESFPFPSGGTPHLVESWTEIIRKYFTFKKEKLNGKLFLDAGCGTGDNALSFAKTFPNLSFQGIDLSNRSIQSATEKLKRSGLTNLSFQSADLTSFKSNILFDYISCLGVLHHTASPSVCLKNLLKVLKPGGFIFIDLYGYYGYFTAERLRSLINMVEPNLNKIEQRLEMMSWVVESLLRIRLPSQREHPGYISFVDGYLSPFARSYTIEQSIALLRSEKLKNIEWLDCPIIENKNITYKNYRGEILSLPLSSDLNKKAKKFSLKKKYRFFELCFAPFDYF